MGSANADVPMMPSAQHHWKPGESGPTEPISRSGVAPRGSSQPSQRVPLALSLGRVPPLRSRLLLQGSQAALTQARGHPEVLGL